MQNEPVRIDDFAAVASGRPSGWVCAHLFDKADAIEINQHVPEFFLKPKIRQ